MDRQALLSLLDRYESIYPRELQTVARIRKLVNCHQDCFERTCLPGHVTASAWILSPERDRCLLTLHRKLGRWLQLGGHADGDSAVLNVALREAREESGLEHFLWICGSGEPASALAPLPLDVDVHRIPARGSEPEHEHHDIRFLLVAADGQSLRISEESTDLRWFEFSLLAELGVDESVLRLARKAEPLLKHKAYQSV